MNMVRTIASNAASSCTATAGGRKRRRRTVEWTFGAGRNAPGGKDRSGRDVGMQLDEDREHAIIAGPGLRVDALRDFPLQHERGIDEGVETTMRGEE